MPLGVGRDLVESALDTSEEVAPLEQIEKQMHKLVNVLKIRDLENGEDLETVTEVGIGSPWGSRAGFPSLSAIRLRESPSFTT